MIQNVIVIEIIVLLFFLSKIITFPINKAENINNGQKYIILWFKSTPEAIVLNSSMEYGPTPVCKLEFSYNVWDVAILNHSPVPEPPGVNDIELAVPTISSKTILVQYPPRRLDGL